MNGKDLFEKITDIDDELILNVDKNTKNNLKYIKFASLVACFAVIISAVAIFEKNINHDTFIDLPTISIDDTTVGMGMEAYIAYEISDLVNANPWSEISNIEYLPVFKNQVLIDENYKIQENNTETMENLLLEFAKRLEMEDVTMKILPYNETSRYIYDENYEVKIDQALTVIITFLNPIEINSCISSFNGNFEEKTQAGESFIEEFSEIFEILGVKSPVLNVNGGNFTFTGEQIFNTAFFEGSENLTQSILNYNFKFVQILENVDSDLQEIAIIQTDLSEKIADYPIISIDEAKEYLKNGNYVTSVPYEFSDISNIESVELIYKNSVYNEYFIPYYKFLMYLPEEKLENGLKSFGAYYVPAIDEKYIEYKLDLPQENDRFN